jgi:hypothetical protein
MESALAEYFEQSLYPEIDASRVQKNVRVYSWKWRDQECARLLWLRSRYAEIGNQGCASKSSVSS